MLGAFCREEGECDTSLSKQEGKEPDLAEKGKALGRGGHSGQMLGGGRCWGGGRGPEMRLEQCVSCPRGPGRMGQDGGRLGRLEFVISPAFPLHPIPPPLLLCSCVGDWTGCSFIR